MKTIVIAALAYAASPAPANVYKCSSGKVIYQDEPCPSTKPVKNINGQVSWPHGRQFRATERALVPQQAKALAAEDSKVTATMGIAEANPPPPKPNYPDAYYDCPDRYCGDRRDHTTGTTRTSLPNKGNPPYFGQPRDVLRYSRATWAETMNQLPTSNSLP